MTITVRPVIPDEFDALIAFDAQHLLEVMHDIGIEKRKCPPKFTQEELKIAYNKKDILLWLFMDNQLAGYIWRESRPPCIFGAGAAIKKEFYGMGLSQFIINATEQMAKEAGLKICQLAVIPENGRVISAYMRHGYHIVDCIPAYCGPDYPDTFRCIMEKRLERTPNNKTRIDRCEVPCNDETQLKTLTDKGYVGVHLIRPEDKIPGKHKLVFEKYV